MYPLPLTPPCTIGPASSLKVLRPEVCKLLSVLALFFLVSCTEGPGPGGNTLENHSTLSLTGYVNPLMGTDSQFSFSNGNTYPAIATPWGMHFWTPMTSRMGDGWTYKYDDQKIRGIKQTHQPSPWINDYGAFSLMAVTGALKIEESERASWFSHKSETARPHYYKVYLADYDASVEVAPTDRAAHFRFTFAEQDSAYILLDGFFGGSMVKVMPEERKIVGYARNNSGGVPGNFHNYFVAVFDKAFEEIHTWTDGYTLHSGNPRAEGDHVGAAVRFATQDGEKVHVRVASSFISPQQAERNLEQELGGQTFEETQRRAQEVWERELGRIRISDPNTEHLKTFYSCLYRLLLFPRKFYEIDAEGTMVHYSPYNGEVLPGYMFTDNGFWDTFRAVFPFFNLMYPEFTAEVMKGLANTYRESGWLPEWASPGHRGAMIGSNSASIIADAYIKGNIPNEKDARTLLEALLKNARVEAGRPVSSVGREGLGFYNQQGYVPCDVGIRENAARTLEYAYADFCLATMAEAMGETALAEQFYGQAMNYKHLFDSETGWMRGKNQNGSFQKPFNPLKWGDAFTEGNALHYTWSVFQDVAGLKALMGGDQAFVAKLDTVFETPPDFDASYYGQVIHEIREMQVADMGNYAHGNQPVQHMIYLYNYAGAYHRAQYWVREVLNRLYRPTPDGYCGDEDNGQTSAWFVFSSLGFYPVTPGTDQYVIGSPLFQKVEMQLPNGNTLTLRAPQNGPGRPYLQALRLNGHPYRKTFLEHHRLLQGGTLEFDMGDRPNPEWGGEGFDKPFSMSSDR